MTGTEKFNSLRERLRDEPEGREQALSEMIDYLRDSQCILLSPVLSRDEMNRLNAAQAQGENISLWNDMLKPLTTQNPQGERRLAVFLSKEQIPPENTGMVEIKMPFTLACAMVKESTALDAIVIDYASPKSLTLLPDTIDCILYAKKKDEQDSHVEINEAARKNMLTAQLLARYHYYNDKQSLEEFQRRMDICKISKEKADSLMKSDMEIISGLDKRFLCDPDFIKSWYFTCEAKSFGHDVDHYINHKIFTTSESMKIFDEASWHVPNSHERELADDVWSEIWQYSSRGHGKTLLSAIDRLKALGWSREEADRYLINEKHILGNVKWGYDEANPYLVAAVEHNVKQPQETKQNTIAPQSANSPGKKPKRNKRKVYLGLTIFCGMNAFVGIAGGIVAFIPFYTPLFILFLWLFIKNKPKETLAEQEPPTGPKPDNGEAKGVKGVGPYITELLLRVSEDQEKFIQCFQFRERAMSELHFEMNLGVEILQLTSSPKFREAYAAADEAEKCLYAGVIGQQYLDDYNWPEFVQRRSIKIKSAAAMPHCLSLCLQGVLERLIQSDAYQAKTNEVIKLYVPDDGADLSVFEQDMMRLNSFYDNFDIQIVRQKAGPTENPPEVCGVKDIEDGENEQAITL